MRDGAFYLKRHWRKYERRVKRMSPATMRRLNAGVRDGTVEHAWMRTYQPGARWRWRRNRVEMRAHTSEQRTSIEIALELISREFQAWPDRWEHRHHFGGPLGDKRCSCGKCVHDKSYYMCDQCSEVGKAMQAILPLVAPVATLFLSGLFRRDVQ